jgi:hypothetical protein
MWNYKDANKIKVQKQHSCVQRYTRKLLVGLHNTMSIHFSVIISKVFFIFFMCFNLFIVVLKSSLHHKFFVATHPKTFSFIHLFQKFIHITLRMCLFPRTSLHCAFIWSITNSCIVYMFKICYVLSPFFWNFFIKKTWQQNNKEFYSFNMGYNLLVIRVSKFVKR